MTMPTGFLNLAGRAFEFGGAERPVLPDAYRPFKGPSAGTVAGRYRIVNGLPGLQADDEFLWTGPTWRMAQEKGAYRIDLRILDSDTWMTTARFTEDFSRGEILPLSGRDPRPSPFALNYPLDQILFINRLARCGVVLLHASGILYDGKIRLFAGRSDIGKTTLARLWRDAGATLLNDDRMLVWMDNGTPTASPCPWHGEDPEINLHTAPVSGIYHLAQANENHLSPLQGAPALAALTATAVLPFYLPASLNPALETLHAIAETTPSSRFAFRPDPSAVTRLKETPIA